MKQNLITGLLFAAVLHLHAVTLEQLQNNRKLTPKRFARHFGSFEFESHDAIQKPEVFLKEGRGDCDDYATLADSVLRPKGYETRLVYVHMDRSTAHSVCYIGEEGGYLDFNNRAYMVQVQRCGSSLNEIADKVAKSFGMQWNFVSEYTYNGGKQKFLTTVQNPLSEKGNSNVAKAKGPSSLHLISLK